MRASTPPSGLEEMKTGACMRRPRHLSQLAATLLLVALFSIGVFVLALQHATWDFLMLWTGARLVGPDMYDWQMAADIQRAIEHRQLVSGFVRLPFEALALWPLTQLPFCVAFRIWQALNLCALLAFVWLWSPRLRSFLVAALFVPAWFSIAVGHETCILLLLVGSGVLLIDRRKDFAGGFVLALCSVKPHLFLFLPVLLVAQRRWRAIRGLLVGEAVIYGISAAVVGLDWPLKFLASVEINRRQFQLFSPGLSGAFSQFHAPIWVMVTVEAALVLPVYFMLRKQSWITAAACVTAIGVLLAPWSFFYDLLLLLPAVLYVLAGEFSAPAAPIREHAGARQM